MARLKGAVGSLSVEGKVMVLRLLWGVVVGVVFWLIDGRLISLSGGWVESGIGWFLATILYFATIPIVSRMFKGLKKTYILGKGVTLYYSAWILTWFTLYNLNLPEELVTAKNVTGGP